MNDIVNNFSLVRGKFMPKLNLKETGFTYSVRGAFTKHRKRIQQFKVTGGLNYIYKKELNKSLFWSRSCAC